MRDLDRNKQTLWLVNCTGEGDKLDSDGFYTGEVIKTYGTPTQIRLMMFPANGKIVEQAFGTDVSYDMIASSSDIDLKADSLLFLSQPTTDYDTTYDFRVIEIKKSINSTLYGLRSRT